jgi:hypothetical protein
MKIWLITGRDCRTELRSALFLEFHLAKLFQFSAKSMSERALGPQFVKQALCLLKGLLIELSTIEQSSPALIDLLFRKQSRPLWVKNREVSTDPWPGDAVWPHSRRSWLERGLLREQIRLPWRHAPEASPG